MKDRIRSNYHWVIAAVVLIEMLVWGGIGNNINGLFVIPVTESLEVSRGSYSLVMSLSSLMGFVSTMVSGVLFMQFGYKKLVLGGLTVAGLALCFLFGSSKNLATLGFGVAIYGFCGGFCSTAGMTKIIGDWFHMSEAEKLGWDNSRNDVSDVAPGKSIGGDRFGNYEGLLPKKSGRQYYEADCYYTGGNRNAHRIVYSNDGLVFYTDDHYESFVEMSPTVGTPRPDVWD